MSKNTEIDLNNTLVGEALNTDDDIPQDLIALNMVDEDMVDDDMESQVGSVEEDDARDRESDSTVTSTQSKRSSEDLSPDLNINERRHKRARRGQDKVDYLQMAGKKRPNKTTHEGNTYKQEETGTKDLTGTLLTGTKSTGTKEFNNNEGIPASTKCREGNPVSTNCKFCNDTKLMNEQLHSRCKHSENKLTKTSDLLHLAEDAVNHYKSKCEEGGKIQNNLQEDLNETKRKYDELKEASNKTIKFKTRSIEKLEESLLNREKSIMVSYEDKWANERASVAEDLKKLRNKNTTLEKEIQSYRKKEQEEEEKVIFKQTQEILDLLTETCHGKKEAVFLIGDSNCRNLVDAVLKNSDEIVLSRENIMRCDELYGILLNNSMSEQFNASCRSSDVIVVWLGLNDIQNGKPQGYVTADQLKESKKMLEDKYKKMVVVVEIPKMLVNKPALVATEFCNQILNRDLPNNLLNINSIMVNNNYSPEEYTRNEATRIHFTTKALFKVAYELLIKIMTIVQNTPTIIEIRQEQRQEPQQRTSRRNSRISNQRRNTTGSKSPDISRRNNSSNRTPRSNHSSLTRTFTNNFCETNGNNSDDLKKRTRSRLNELMSPSERRRSNEVASSDPIRSRNGSSESYERSDAPPGIDDFEDFYIERNDVSLVFDRGGQTRRSIMIKTSTYYYVDEEAEDSENTRIVVQGHPLNRKRAIKMIDDVLRSTRMKNVMRNITTANIEIQRRRLRTGTQK